MMRETLRLLASPIRGLQAAVYILAASAVASSLLALLRDRLFAAHFGAGVELDLYYAAFRIPDLIFVGTGALVSVYVLIPELAKRSEEAKRHYIDSVLVGFSILAVAVSALASLLAPKLLSLLFPQFGVRGDLPILISMTRIMLLQPILLGFSNILAAITQASQRYALYSLSPLLYNLGIIAGLFVLYPVFGLQGLAWGVVFGALLHMGIQIPSIVHDGYLNTIPRLRTVRALMRTALVSVPRALTLSMNQLVFLGLISIASSLAAGSIAVFMFAFNLQAVPLSIIGASYSVAAFPTLAAALSSGRREEFVDHIASAARYVLFWSLPCSALILVLRAHIVRVILGSGAFNWTDTRLTAAAFGIFALSLAAQGLMLLLVRGYYASGRTFTPFFVAAVSAAGTILCALILVHSLNEPAALSYLQSLLRLEDVPGSQMLALALSFTVISIGGVIALMIHFERRFQGFLAKIQRSFSECLLAAFASGAAAYLVLGFVSPLTFTSTLLSVFLRGSAGGVAGLLAAALVYAILQNKEFVETISGVRAHLWREPVLPVAAATAAEEMTVVGPQQ